MQVQMQICMYESKIKMSTSSFPFTPGKEKGSNYNQSVVPNLDKVNTDWFSMSVSKDMLAR